MYCVDRSRSTRHVRMFRAKRPNPRRLPQAVASTPIVRGTGARAARYDGRLCPKDARRGTLKWGRGRARPRPGGLLVSCHGLRLTATTRRTIVPDAAPGEKPARARRPRPEHRRIAMTQMDHLAPGNRQRHRFQSSRRLNAARLGGFGGTSLVAGVRCSFRGKDAGSARTRLVGARLRTPHRGEQRGPGHRRRFAEPS